MHSSSKIIKFITMMFSEKDFILIKELIIFFNKSILLNLSAILY